jgi:hypothetical protein
MATRRASRRQRGGFFSGIMDSLFGKKSNNASANGYASASTNATANTTGAPVMGGRRSRKVRKSRKASKRSKRSLRARRH